MVHKLNYLLFDIHRVGSRDWGTETQIELSWSDSLSEPEFEGNEKKDAEKASGNAENPRNAGIWWVLVPGLDRPFLVESMDISDQRKWKNTWFAASIIETSATLLISFTSSWAVFTLVSSGTFSAKFHFSYFCLFWLSGIRFFDFLIFLIFERSLVDYKRVVACDHISVYYLILTMLSFNHQWIFHLFQWKLYWISRIMVHQAARSSSGRCPWRGGRKTLPDILLF